MSIIHFSKYDYMKKTFSLIQQFFCMLIFFSIPIASIHAQQMIFVEGGKFKMGSNKGHEDERPVHEVKVEDFYIGKYEVTVSEYREFCKATGHKMPPKPDWGWHDNHPIVGVSWFDAIAYCEWLKKKTGKPYRLPTEAEWEYAAKGGRKSKGYKYAGSNKQHEVSWYDETTNEEGTRPVGILKPNELGIYDMSGNVWEWCHDKYKYYEGNDGSAPIQGFTGAELRVLRGGSWYYDVQYSRVTARDGPEATFANKNYGFRLAMSRQ